MGRPMLKIFPAKSSEDIEIAKMLFTEYAEFLKEVLYEHANLPWLVEYYRDLEKEVDHLPDRYRQPEGAILLAEYNDQPAGCVALGRLSDDICEMKRLFIRPENRRKSIGTALCEALVDRAKKAGYTHMRLATVMEEAKVLYHSLGFKKTAPYRDIPSELKSVAYMELNLV